ncbi:MAG TPA: hypothetical protein VL984_09510 [Acidimicrobiales bacterium]|nr:hypothetical protein [Acidimicrobiales bacterium]
MASFFRGTPSQGVAAFRDELVSRGVNATVRANRGTDIDAACGQLAAEHAPGRVALIAPQPVPH